jgi:hypothetical protein
MSRSRTANEAQIETSDPLLHKHRRVPLVTAGTDADSPTGPVATRDHDVIRRWAALRQAEPATGEATGSGGATVDIHDGGAGIRFNFPGFARLRPITWDEWFANFDRHKLTFVYERQADHEPLSPRYRIVKTEEWSAEIG